MIDADSILLLISSTLILCYISGLFYTKTKIPDAIWALGFGILLGPILGYFEKDLFLSIAPIMSTLALNIILFDAGINLDINKVFKNIIKASVLSITTILTVIIIVGFVLSFLFPSDFTLLQGMLLGAMVGGTSTIAVIGVIGGLEKIISKMESARVILIMESVISDPICIIASITLIKMIIMPEVYLIDSLIDILTIFLLSLGLGFIIGIIWAEVLNFLKKRSFNYMLTLAVLFLMYIITERLIGEGGGPIAALIFGLTLTNRRLLLKKIRIKSTLEIDTNKIIELHEEICFFIKSFFFVYIGIIITFSSKYIIIGLGIFALIQVVRYGVVTILGRGLKFSFEEKVLTRLIYTSGLPAFVMSQLPLLFDPNRQYFSNPEIYPNLAMPIVLGTILFAAFAGPVIARKQLRLKRKIRDKKRKIRDKKT